MSVAANMSLPTSNTSGVGAQLVDTEGRVLPLRGTKLEAVAGAGLARVSLKQCFYNPYQEGLRVTYKLPLPSDAAVAGFAFEIDGRKVSGEVQTKQKARETFEEAVMEGRTAAILEEERSSLFTQEVGNIPPEKEVWVEVSLDQPLKWITSALPAHANSSEKIGGWEFRFPTVVGPRYLGEPGKTKDADKVTVQVANKTIDARCKLSLTINDELTQGHPHSPIHSLRLSEDSYGFEALDGVLLDRDLVIRWPVAKLKASASLEVGRPAEGHARGDNSYGLLTLVPPSIDTTPVARDLCFLIDVSGSQSGEPMDQSKKVMRALVDSLSDQDQLQMMAFSYNVIYWKKKPVRMDASGKLAAHKWLTNLEAGGCTNMDKGIYEALKPLRKDSQRQILVVTDGYIGSESEIVKQVRNKLPTSSRVHTLGVGHGINRSLTTPVARVGNGQEMIVAPGEDAENAAQKLLAFTDRPQVVDLTISGPALVARAQQRLPDLYAAAPATIALALKPEGGALTISGQTAQGTWAEELIVPAQKEGQGMACAATLYARELVTDLEAEREAKGASISKIDQKIESIGVDFQISTRLTSWVAVDEEVSVDPTKTTREETMPHMLPAGVSAEGVGLRPQVSAAAPAMRSMALGGALSMDLDEEEASYGGGGIELARAELAMPSSKSQKKGRGGLARRRRGPAKPSRSPIDAVKDFLGFGTGSAKSELPPDELEAPEPAVIEEYEDFLDGSEAGGGMPVVSGPIEDVEPPGPWFARLRLARNGKVVIELELPEGFEWERPEKLKVVFADGREEELELAENLSTAPGSYDEGAVIKLVLLADEAPQELFFGEIRVLVQDI